MDLSCHVFDDLSAFRPPSLRALKTRSAWAKRLPRLGHPNPVFLKLGEWAQVFQAGSLTFIPFPKQKFRNTYRGEILVMHAMQSDRDKWPNGWKGAHILVYDKTALDYST